MEEEIAEEWDKFAQFPNRLWKQKVREWVQSKSEDDRRAIFELLKKQGYTVKNNKIIVFADRRGVVEVSE